MIKAAKSHAVGKVTPKKAAKPRDDDDDNEDWIDDPEGDDATDVQAVGEDEETEPEPVDHGPHTPPGPATTPLSQPIPDAPPPFIKQDYGEKGGTMIGGVTFFDGPDDVLMIEYRSDPNTAVGAREATPDDIAKYDQPYQIYLFNKASSVTPTLASIAPDTLEVGGEDTVCTITGTGFSKATILVWNGADDTCGFVDDKTLTTNVRASLATSPAKVPFYVRNGELQSNPLEFEFKNNPPETEAEPVKASKRK